MNTHGGKIYFSPGTGSPEDRFKAEAVARVFFCARPGRHRVDPR